MLKKTIAWLVFLAAVGGLGYWVYVKYMQEGQKAPPRMRSGVVAVEVTPVRRATLHDEAYFTGTLLPRSQFVVAPKIAGRLERLMVNIGDSVQPGQEIARLDDQEYAQQVEQAKAELEVAKAVVLEAASAYEAAEKELARARALREKKISSESEFDEAEAKYKAADSRKKVAAAQVLQRQAALEGAQVRLSYATIRAAWQDGTQPRVIGERYVDEGAMLAVNTPIVTVLDIQTVLAVIHVIERDYTRMEVGQEAHVTTDALPGREFAGKIARIAPVLREATRQARVEIELPNAQNVLKPGMFVRARIRFAARPDVTVVPQSALVRREGREGLFLLEEGGPAPRARFVGVKVGIASQDLVEVLSPELTGQVVTLGQHLLQDGTPVALGGGERGQAASRPGQGPPADSGGADKGGQMRKGPGGKNGRPEGGPG